MTIKVLRTNEIDQNTWASITNGFNESFDRVKSDNEFIVYYQNTVLGYSYHALAFDDTGVLAGSTTIIPQYYIVNGEKMLFGLSGGSFVKKKFRSDIFIFSDMFEALRLHCNEENIKVFLGVPNKNSYKYSLNFLNQKHILDIEYYALPIHFGTVINSKNKYFLNVFSSTFSFLLQSCNSFLSLLKNFEAIPSKISLLYNEDFIKHRFSKGYKVYQTGAFFFAYKMVNENGVKTAYLLHYRENDKKTSRALTKAINFVRKNENPDLILYIGSMHHTQFNLFKVPKKRVPQQLPLVYEVLSDFSESFKEILSNDKNWDFGLANFDVR